MFPFDPFVFSVVRTTTFRPSTDVAKSIISSTEPTHRFVSPALGTLSHSLTVSVIIVSIEELSPAWNICFITPSFELEKGSLDRIDRGKNDLFGILSLMSGIAITDPFLSIDSRKNFPGSTHLFARLPLTDVFAPPELTLLYFAKLIPCFA